MDASLLSKRSLIVVLAIALQACGIFAIVPVKAALTSGGTDILVTVTSIKTEAEAPPALPGTVPSGAREDVGSEAPASKRPTDSSGDYTAPAGTTPSAGYNLAPSTCAQGVTMSPTDQTGAYSSAPRSVVAPVSQGPEVPPSPGGLTPAYLTFEISEISPSGFVTLADLTAGSTVYTPVCQEKHHWEISGLVAQVPTQKGGSISVRGSIRSLPGSDGRPAMIVYGIEKLNVWPQDLAYYQKAVQVNRTYAQISVDTLGNARLKGLLVLPRPLP